MEPLKFWNGIMDFAGDNFAKSAVDTKFSMYADEFPKFFIVKTMF